MANGAPTVSNGLVISGVTTSTNVSVASSVTATTFYGSGANLTGIDATKIITGNTQVQTVDTGSDGHVKVTTEGSEKLRITSDGKVGINDTTPDATLSVGGATAFIDVGAAGGNRGKIGYTSNDLYFGTSSGSGQFIFKNNVNSDGNPQASGTERLRIDSSGQFALGRTNQITGNGNQSTSVFEQLSNSNYPLALHSAQSNKRGLMIYYAATGNGNAGDPFIVCTDATNNKFQVTSDGTITNRGNILPAVNNSKDLGSSSLRWANLWTQDLQLSNEAKKDTGGNSVDGTWGDWTLQEGESDVFMINNRSGKKYMFMLKEVV